MQPAVDALRPSQVSIRHPLMSGPAEALRAETNHSAHSAGWADPVTATEAAFKAAGLPVPERTGARMASDAPVPGARAAHDGVWLRPGAGAPQAGSRRHPRLGFDVCCHGWRWIKHSELGEAEEREQSRRAVASLQATVGERPLGWYCRYGPSVNTRRLLVEEGGFLYNSDYYGDELPFWKTVDGRPHLIVPYSLTNNDGKYAGWVGTRTQWFSFIRDAFDMLYRGARRQPKMMSVGLHMRLIGHPGPRRGLERLLDYVVKHDGVWVTRRLDIARHWMATHPYPGKGLNE